MQHHNPSSPVPASSPTLIATPLPGSKTILSLHGRGAPSLGPVAGQPTGVAVKGFIQPHRSNLPRRHIRRREIPTEKVISEAELLEAHRRRWAHTACLQELGSKSGIFIAFSPKQQAVANSIEYTKSGRLSPLFTEKVAEPSCISNEEERPTSSGTSPGDSSSSNSSLEIPPTDKYSQSASEIEFSLLSEFNAIIRIHTMPCPPTSSLCTHDIIVSAETKDDGTPHLTETQFTEAFAFLHSKMPFPSSPPDRPHPRHGTHTQGLPKPKLLILAPKTHAVDALGLAAGWGCLSGLRLPYFEADEEADVDILSNDTEGVEPREEKPIFSGDDSGEDRATPVHTLLMRLHDLDAGLKDEWRGLLSRSGMDVLGSWVAHC